ncbi:MAG TPA: aminotransferase class V-fold PLP-dependent enzyme [Thermoanaerobaculia bacterium]|nr:aminotransferase class V-fold PLP-dependent enzyme [Thermoanaerobaculia bacterium]
MLSAAAVRDDASYFAELRAREFARLDEQHHAYLDYTGSALYAESQLDAHRELLRHGLFGNPHSDSAPSRASTEVIEQMRARVLRHFDVDASTHAVIFTANTSAAIKLVAESYPFTPRLSCVLSADNHNSVNGIREYAVRAHAHVCYIPLDDELRMREPRERLARERGGLFAFPAQSNFSGVQHPLSLIDDAHALGFDVLLDMAAYAPSHVLSLRAHAADFAALSFYKAFGFPTGIGALIARREALAKLRRPWFAGGTVLYASVNARTHRLRASHEAFEDGTPDFLGIAAIESGLDLLESAQLHDLTAHVKRLTHVLLDGLRAMPHVRIYGPMDLTNRGGTIAFNVDGLPYWDVEARARECGISIRGGCFCNPGASEQAFGLRDAAPCLDRLGDAFTPARFAACAQTAVGAVRVSPGLANHADDVRRLLALVAALA